MWEPLERMRHMEMSRGSVPMPDPMKVLNPLQLLMLYGMLERATHRITEVAYLSGWKWDDWVPLSTDLEVLAIEAYYHLAERLGRSPGEPGFLYHMPTKPEWQAEESGESQ